MADTNISNLLDVTMDKLRTAVDSDTIIGEKIVVGEITIIPVSKVSFGLASGGSDFGSKSNSSKMFGGGGGAGATVNPVCFLVVKGDEVKVLNTSPSSDITTSIEKAIDAVPEIVNKISGLFKKDSKETEK